jgi:PAS domain S-box-containing protein
MPKTRLAILRIVFVYFLVSSIYIGFSDRAIGWITQDPDQLVTISTYKGTAFVIVTSILMFFLLRTEIIKLEDEIEKRRKVSEDLRQSNEQLSAILSSSPLAIVAVDAQQNVEIWNPAAEQVFGWTAAEVAGKPTPYLPDEVQVETQERRKKILAGQIVPNIELRMRTKDNRLIDVILSSAPVHDQNGEIRLLLGIFIDISARKRAEENLRHLSEELEQRVKERTADLAAANQNLRAQVEERERAEKELIAARNRLSETNKELETFSYSVSHDLRAPLRQISGYAGLLMEESSDSLTSQAHQDLMHIQAGVGQMNELIDALLTLSRATRGTVEYGVINLTEMAQEIVQVLQQQNADRHVQVTIQPELTARGDTQMVRILLTNILENAWKFTREMDPAAIELGSTGNKQSRTVFFVRDTGIGFDMTQSDRLFKPFQRFHPVSAYPGSGIGLATVARIVQRHGGEVWAKSEPGQGTTFFFTLGIG